MTRTPRDLDLAAKALERMADATQFPDFVDSWQEFLFRLERAWEVITRQLSGTKGFQAWQSQNAEIRRKDQLLRYIKQARNTEMHALEETVGRDILVSVRDRLGREFKLDSVEISFKDGILTYNLNTPDEHLQWDAQLLPGDPRLRRFKNRGKWYNPPTEHLGNSISDLHPVAVAELAFVFYNRIFSELQTHT